MKNKDTIEKDINDLKQHLKNYVSSEQMYELFDKKADLKKELEEEKKVYAILNKNYKKNNRIKNLVITTKVSIFLVPIVIVPGILGTIFTDEMMDAYKDKNISANSNYVEECLYIDNFGSKIVLEEEVYDEDFLRIETAYEKMDNGSYLGKVYEYDKSVDFIEDMEEKVNTNYIELLEDLESPSYENTVIKETVDEENNRPKVSMVAKVYEEVGEDINNDAVIKGEELLSNLRRNSILDGLAAWASLALIGFCVAAFSYVFSDSKLSRAKEKYKFKANEYVYERKNSKKKMKELKKELKRK